MGKPNLHPDLIEESPKGPDELFDLGFLDARAKILDLAAFLDRIERHSGSFDDYRGQSLKAALRELSSGAPGRTERILNLFSDPTTDPIAKAPGKAANGAWDGFENREPD